MSTNWIPLPSKPILFCGLLVYSTAFFCRQGGGATLGSSPLRRQFVDIDAGQVYIYRCRGLQSTGHVLNWAFFDDRNAGLSVTPLVLRQTGPTGFMVTGIGTTRKSAGTGLQSFSFDPIAGSARVAPGYTFGFANRAYSVKANRLVPGVPNTGVICFDRPSATIPSDPWLVTAAISSGGAIAPAIGTIIGTGAVPAYNSIDPGGFDRVYSAQVTTVPEVAGGIDEPIQILYPRLSQGNFRFSVQTRPDQVYTLQQSTNLSQDGWFLYTNFLGSGSAVEFEVPIADNPVQFFRVIGP